MFITPPLSVRSRTPHQHCRVGASAAGPAHIDDAAAHLRVMAFTSSTRVRRSGGSISHLSNLPEFKPALPRPFPNRFIARNSVRCPPAVAVRHSQRRASPRGAVFDAEHLRAALAMGSVKLPSPQKNRQCVRPVVVEQADRAMQFKEKVELVADLQIPVGANGIRCQILKAIGASGGATGGWNGAAVSGLWFAAVN